MKESGASRCQLFLRAGLGKVADPFRGMCREASCKAEDPEIFLLPSNTGRGILMKGVCFLFPEGPIQIGMSRHFQATDLGLISCILV